MQIFHGNGSIYKAGFGILAYLTASPTGMAVLTDEVHADPVPGIHLLLDVPPEHDVLRLADGVEGAADGQCGAAVAGE